MNVLFFTKLKVSKIKYNFRNSIPKSVVWLQAWLDLEESQVGFPRIRACSGNSCACDLLREYSQEEQQGSESVSKT